MTDIIKEFFVGLLGPELGVLICSMLPIIECRGAVPMGALLNLPWWETMLFAVAGNILPVPFILLFIRKVLEWMRNSRVKFFNKVANWLDRKVEKRKSTIEKYSYLGVMIFVAIPFPGTGAWTGTLIASVLKMDPKKSFLAALGGVLIATTIMTLGSYGAVELFQQIF